ncbi:ribosomal protein L15 [Punctularia strigosozonata HHB-11173 SS5]|uniref:ribosomal protein L15 n=1 Tax=Punctularia strigosozonata (strain HHB-11173) TaxID=741275 RepID=UPI0004417231|nr:ribosomal protein L15 [Punctularia strigosozonata HHB-11173 SS5]EIN07645.1 ribosomal protein L15 [Punctularia strigosozonata HHB-11173 SS5]
MLKPTSVRGATSKVHLLNLSPAEGSLHSQKRVGRGRRSGLGKTSGRGHKGQKARGGNGKPRLQFEGGQTPLVRLIPKRGFINPHGKTYAPVNLDRVQHWIETGRLTSSPDKPITARELLLSGCIHDVHDGVKLLGDGAKNLRTPIHIAPSRASASAIKAVEEAGGSVFCRYYNRLALYDCVKGRTDRVDAAPTKREDILWYTSFKNRGYLAPESIARMPVVQERWKTLSEQLTAYRKEDFDRARK